MAAFSDVLLTVDYDRTLTAPDSTIPQRNLEAIRYFIDNGGAFTVNTGRSVPMSMQNILPAVPVSAPLLLYNGSAAYDTQSRKITQESPIALDPKVLIDDLIRRFPALNMEIQGEHAHYLCRKNPGWEAYCENNGCAWEYVTTDSVPRPFLKLAVYGEFRENTVASMFEASEAELALFREAIDYIEQHYGDQVDVFRACARIADIHAKGCSKLRAARDLQKAMSRKYLVCVGDAENDLPMLEGADFAYCPADGVVAGRFENVCPCGDGAVADVIYKKIPEILEK